MALRPGDFNPEIAAEIMRSKGMTERAQKPPAGRLVTKGQRLLFTIYLLAVMTTCLFPPWVVESARHSYSSPAEYRFIGDPPRTGINRIVSIDVARLFLTLAAISAAAGVVALWLPKPVGPRRGNKGDYKQTSLRNPLAEDKPNPRARSDKVLNQVLRNRLRGHVPKRHRKAPASASPEVSARQALLGPLKLQSKSRLKAIASKLQKIGKANGPNDPSLT